MYPTLRTEGGAVRKGYLNILDVCYMDWRDAECFWGDDPASRQKTRLTSESLQAVLAACAHVTNYVPEQQYYHSTTTISKRIQGDAPAPELSDLAVPGPAVPCSPSWLGRPSSPTESMMAARSVPNSIPARDAGYVTASQYTETEPLLPSYRSNSSQNTIREHQGFWRRMWHHVKTIGAKVFERCFGS